MHWFREITKAKLSQAKFGQAGPSWVRLGQAGPRWAKLGKSAGGVRKGCGGVQKVCGRSAGGRAKVNAEQLQNSILHYFLMAHGTFSGETGN